MLETEFEAADGAATLIDFMPVRGSNSDLVRIVVGRRGRIALRTELAMRFGYGAAVPWVTRMDGGMLRAIAGPDMVVLNAGVALRGQGLKTVGDFALGAASTCGALTSR